MLPTYLSSSDSDGVVPATSKPDKKKGRKKKPPPQQVINQIWREFGAKKSTKALSILPFTNVPQPTGLERDNEVLSAGFQRAAAECKRKVEKIIKECRRVNMRYRDPGFDLDWDLRTGSGNCLNSLGSVKFDVSSYKCWSISTSVPKAVKRIHEIFSAPSFMAEISSSDIKQGALGDCWLISGLSGLANAPELIRRLCVSYDTRVGIYGFVFFRDGEWIYSIIDDKLYLLSADWDHPSLHRHLLEKIDREDNETVYRKTYQSGSKALFFAKNKSQNETWLPLLEKAYAKCHGDYSSLEGGFSGEALEDLTGGVTTEVFTSDILDLDGFWENEITKVNQEFLFSCTTGLMEPGYGDRDGIEEAHAYVLLASRTLTKGEKAGTRLVLLRNPWGATGKGVWEGAFSDGSKEWTPEIWAELGHQFGQDSVFWITYEDLIRKFTQFDRTRLFRDPEWRCCQRYAGCEVPWKPQWEEKFIFSLTKDSPLVLVLNQLDYRYFSGLEGQYEFKMAFRLHEKARLQAEDYVVRSHGNYLMSRSVAVEIPDMVAGEYIVFVSVTATRKTNKPTVEEVVKRETKNRSQNDKLGQVGLAYDLAHAKAAKHIQAMSKQWTELTWKKASEKRKAYRKHDWEKKHLAVNLEKRKAKKDKEKKEKKAAERAARRAKREKEALVQWEAEEDMRIKEEEAEEEKRRRKEAEDEAKKPKDKASQADIVFESVPEEKNYTANHDKTTKEKQAFLKECSGNEGETKENETKGEASGDESKKDMPKEDEAKKNKSKIDEPKEDKAEEGKTQDGRVKHEGNIEKDDDSMQKIHGKKISTLELSQQTRKPSERNKADEKAGSGENIDVKSGDNWVNEDSEGEGHVPTPPGTTPGTERSSMCSPEGSVSGDDNKEKTQDALESNIPEDSKSDETKHGNKPNNKDKSCVDGIDNSTQEVSQRMQDKSTQTDFKEGIRNFSSKEKANIDKSESQKSDTVPQQPVQQKEETPGVSQAESFKDSEERNQDDGQKTTSKTSPEENKDKESGEKKKRKPPKVIHSDTEGDSSASPLSDWEELYSSDDACRRPRRELGRFPSLGVSNSVICDKKHVGEDDDGTILPDPWNAICIVGFRVYSKDDNLKLRIIDVEEASVDTNNDIDGAGKLGDNENNELDNAVLNAAGISSQPDKVEKKGEDELDASEKEDGSTEGKNNEEEKTKEKKYDNQREEIEQDKEKNDDFDSHNSKQIDNTQLNSHKGSDLAEQRNKPEERNIIEKNNNRLSEKKAKDQDGKAFGEEKDQAEDLGKHKPTQPRSIPLPAASVYNPMTFPENVRTPGAYVTDNSEYDSDERFVTSDEIFFSCNE